MAKHHIASEIDEIADGIQSLAKKHPKIANRIYGLSATLDTVSNQLDAEAGRSRRASSENPGMDQGAWGPEAVYDDSYEAEDYHKVPIGNDSLSKAIDKNPADILSDLDFAQSTDGKDKHRILVQSRREPLRQRKASAKWPFKDLSPRQLAALAVEGRWEDVRRAAGMALRTETDPLAGTRSAAKGSDSEDGQDVDLGTFGEEDRLSTADLPEVGDEDIGKPVDSDQQGGILQFYGTTAQKSNDDGPDSGHHRKNVQAPNRENVGDVRVSRKTQARTMLERLADRPVKPEVKDPDDLLDDEPGNNVERDQPLGGLSGQYKGGRSSSRKEASSEESEVKVYRPVHVPKEAHGVWHRAAQKLASTGNLLKGDGRVDYYGIEGIYRKALKYYRTASSKESAGRVASTREYVRTPANVRVFRPDYVPSELNSYWMGAARYLGERNKLVTASGKVDYFAVNHQYGRLLSAVESVSCD